MNSAQEFRQEMRLLRKVVEGKNPRKGIGEETIRNSSKEPKEN